jgi:hypothetical protein
MVLQGLGDAARLRKQRPSGDVDRLTALLAAEESGVFAQAAALAGEWKVEAARGDLEKEFLAADANAGRANAALEGLRAMGGAKTAGFLEKTAREGSASYRLRALAVAGLTRMNPGAGAELAVPLLREAPDAAQAQTIVDAFLVNKEGPAALARELVRPGVSLKPEIALAGMNRASGSAMKPDDLVKAFQSAGGLKPMKLQLSAPEMEAMMARVAKEGDAHRGETVYRTASLQCLVCHAIGGGRNGARSISPRPIAFRLPAVMPCYVPTNRSTVRQRDCRSGCLVERRRVV